MAKQRLSEWDPYSLKKEYFEDDPHTGGYHVHTVQNCEGVLKRAKMIRDAGSWRGEDGDLWHAASVPNIFITKWLREKGMDWFNDDHLPDIYAMIKRDYKWMTTAPSV